jgi:hypothetical protein
MLTNEPQNYANHSRIIAPYHYGLSFILLINLANSGWSLFGNFNFQSILGALMAVAFIGIYWYVRSFPLTVQDRVIRLEMKFRLQQILPEPMRAKIDDLTPGQLVGLRFAGDDELPGLVEEVLDGRLVKQSDIKKKIKNWQADHLRC